MPRLQFSLKTLLWLTVVAAAFSAGQQFEKHRLKWAWDAVDEADHVLAKLLAKARADRHKDREDQSKPSPFGAP
ncbi:MAG TPA: hypothetical protein VG125_02725 [Pirellulales bacterium]|jgi:hypothetical protein|nr:hypothetical protein [Pirellulales bacterium]